MDVQQEISIADRRRVADHAPRDPDFRSRLRDDPTAAVSALVDVDLPGGMAVEVLEEEPGLWRLALPREAAFAEGLPPPVTTRAAWENEICAAIRSDAEARRELTEDPRSFVQRLSGAALPAHRFVVRTETDRQTWIVVDDPSLLDLGELDDEQLDLVAGDRDPASQDGDMNTSRSTAKQA